LPLWIAPVLLHARDRFEYRRLTRTAGHNFYQNRYGREAHQSNPIEAHVELKALAMAGKLPDGNREGVMHEKAFLRYRMTVVSLMLDSPYKRALVAAIESRQRRIICDGVSRESNRPRL
jgi:hypothetical protein